jgi:integrase
MARLRGTRWQADALVDGKRRRVSFATEAEANAWEAEFTHEAEHLPPTSAAVEETLLSLSKTLAKDLWGGGEHAVLSLQNIKQAVSFIGDIRVSTFKNIHVQKLTAAYLAADMGPATINRKYATMSRLLRRAVKIELLDKMPDFERKKEPKGRDRYLTPVEEEKLFAHLLVIDQRDHDLAVFLVDTGCRLGEAFSLKWYQVNMGSKRVTFDKTKADVTRTVSLTRRVVEILIRTQGNERPFSDINRWTARDHWNRARKAAGFEHDPLIVPHILRHTCASRIVQDGHSLLKAQRWLGHSSPAMTGRYAHLAPDTLDSVVETLDRGGRA